MSNSKNEVIVTLPYGALDGVFEWCKEQCVGEWDLVEITDYAGFTCGTYLFQFHGDQDVILFTLRWA